MKISHIFEQTHTMIEINRGKQSAVFSAAKDGDPVFIMKKNTFYRVIVTPNDYELLRKLKGESEPLPFPIQPE